MLRHPREKDGKSQNKGCSPPHTLTHTHPLACAHQNQRPRARPTAPVFTNQRLRASPFSSARRARTSFSARLARSSASARSAKLTSTSCASVGSQDERVASFFAVPSSVLDAVAAIRAVKASKRVLGEI